jgi:hypothetical protein
VVKLGPGLTQWALTIVVIVLILALLAAATLVVVGAVIQPTVTPTISLEPNTIAPGEVVVVRGKGWPSVLHYVVVLALSPTEEAPSVGLVPVGAVNVALDGTFSGTFVYPADVPWTAVREAWVVARPATGELQAQAHLLVNPPRVNATLAPAPAATPLVGRQQVQGVIVQTSLEQGLLIVRPFNSTADRGVIMSGAAVRFADGRNGTSADLKAGVAVVALGWLDSGGSLVADQITILESATPPAASSMILPAQAVPTRARRVTPTAIPTPVPTPVPADCWLGEYYPNPWFMGQPVLVKDNRVIDYSWRNGAPVDGMPVAGYSVRWVGTWRFPRTARYRFVLAMDGNARLLVDGQVVVDRCDNPPPAEYSGEINLAGGLHTMLVEYRNMGSAGRIQLRWEYANPGL